MAKSKPQNRNRHNGHAFERAVVKLMLPYFPGAQRNNQSGLGGGSVAGGDVLNTPWHVECKYEQDISFPAAIRQAERDTKGEPTMVVCQRRPNKVKKIYHKGPIMVAIQEHTQAALVLHYGDSDSRGSAYTVTPIQSAVYRHFEEDPRKIYLHRGYICCSWEWFERYLVEAPKNEQLSFDFI